MKTLKTRKPRSFLSFSWNRFPLQSLANLYSLLHRSFKTFINPLIFPLMFAVCSSILKPFLHTCPLAGSWMIFFFLLSPFNSCHQRSQAQALQSSGRAAWILWSCSQCSQFRAHLPAGCCPRWPCEVGVALHSAEGWLPGGAAAQPSFLGITHGHLLTSTCSKIKNRDEVQIWLSLPSIILCLFDKLGSANSECSQCTQTL